MPMLGAAATQDTIRLVRSGVRKLIVVVRVADRMPPVSSSQASTSTTSARAGSPTAIGGESVPRRVELDVDRSGPREPTSVAEGVRRQLEPICHSGCARGRACAGHEALEPPNRSV